MARRTMLQAVGLLAAAALLLPAAAQAGRPRNPHEPRGFRTFASPQSNPIAVSADGQTVYVANTTSGTLGIVDVASAQQVREVRVGLEPVSVALKPDGSEAWVSNHVSDSVSVVDVNPASASYGTVIETVQLLDAEGATLFDEPVGIAFASNAKAYVALSSRNQVAIVDTATYSVSGTLDITAQEPRALAVRNGRLYVAAFESGNKTEVSACTSTGNDQCTMDLNDLINFAQDPNLPGVTKNIVVDPQVPDRDVFVFNTTNDQLVATADSVGTLLYGIAPGPSGTLYVAQTDARNAVNGANGLNLIDLDNHLFDNQIAEVSCSGSNCSATVHDAEPLPPSQATAFATPYGIALSGDDSVLLATAAASSRLGSFDAANPGAGALDVLDVGAIPRGLAFHSAGATGTAFVLNTLDNTVSVVDVGAAGALSLTTTIPVGSDPTPDPVRRGRIAFNNAFGSTSGNFACASCHPDGNTDQLLWRIGGACFFGACDGNDEPRTTMPIRGLKNTLPLHWDGTLGDPFGGGNGAVGVSGSGGTDCTLGDADGDHDCFVDLVEQSLAGVMCDQTGACPPDNELSAQEIDDMAFFLANVSYPPARSRRMDDDLSRAGSGVMVGSIEASAVQGFADFFTNQGGNTTNPATCADSDAGCHTLPLGTDTNSATLNGFDVPTMRGMTDRFLQFSLGPTAAEEILVFANNGFQQFGIPPLEQPIQWDPNVGMREITTFGAAFTIFDLVYNVRPIHLFQMFEEASTGYSGATGRQITLNTATANLADTVAVMTALEDADARGVINLRAHGMRNGLEMTFSFRDSGVYQSGGLELTPSELRAEAAAGTALMTLTGELRRNVGTQPAPLLDTTGSPGGSVIGDPPLAQLTGSATSFTATGTDVSRIGAVFLDGQLMSGGAISCGSGSGLCPNGPVTVDLGVHPSDGLHVVQVQNPLGLLSNELPICVGSNANACLSD